MLREHRSYVDDNGRFGCMADETLESACREDLKFLRDHPWVREESQVHGFVLDSVTGQLAEV